MIDAYITHQKEVQEIEWMRTAWQTAHLLNIAGKSLKKDVTVDTLLGKEKEKKTEIMSEDDRKKALENLKAKFS